LKYEIAFDTTAVVSESIVEVVETLLLAIVFVVLTMFLFLQDWRKHLDPGGDDPGVARGERSPSSSWPGSRSTP